MKLSKPFLFLLVVSAALYVSYLCFTNWPWTSILIAVGLIVCAMFYISRTKPESFHDRLITFLKTHLEGVEIREGDNHGKSMSYRNNFWLYARVPGGDIEKLFVDLCDFFHKEGFEPVSDEAKNCHHDRACARFVHADGEKRVLMISRAQQPQDEFQIKVTPSLDESE